MKRSQLREYIRKHINEIRLKSGDKHYRFSPKFINQLNQAEKDMEAWNRVSDAIDGGEYRDDSDFSYDNLITASDALDPGSPNIYNVALYLSWFISVNIDDINSIENMDALEVIEDSGFTEDDIQVIKDLGWLV